MMLSQSEYIENQGVSMEMNFYSNPTNSTFLPPLFLPQQPLKPLIMPFSLATDDDAETSNDQNQTLLLSSSTSSCSSSTPKPRQDMGVTQLQTSIPNLWAWQEEGKECMEGNRGNSSAVGDEKEYQVGISPVKIKKIKEMRRMIREPRFCFKTLSDVDVLDDGYKWRKYGQKIVKNTHHPRSYYRCTYDNCNVKKRVERSAEDSRMVITTYEGRHIHSPSHDLEKSQGQPQLSNFFW